ncbi:MAG: alg44 [Moraxellaceae bacterium]|jgi:alginate biosynthesis protein Alg44|nr:alg44 [Moraxellaceae bacterium]
MSDKSPRIVHESEAHRQHVRIRLPGTVIVRDSRDDKVAEFELLDISVGGFSLKPCGTDLAPGELLHGDLVLKYESFTYSIGIHFQAKVANEERIGCMFQDVGPTEGDALRAIIGSFLAGDVVQLNDMLQIMRRDNSANARKAGSTANPPVVKGVAIAGTIMVLTLGFLAFAYVFSQVYGVLFVNSAESAVVTTNVHYVRMPVDGTFQSLLRPGERKVRKGQPLGTYSEILPPMPVRGQDSSAPRQMTFMSPCDCEVLGLPLGESGVLRKGDPVFQMRAPDSHRWVSALYTPKQALELLEGDDLRVVLPVQGLRYAGRVSVIDASRIENSQVADNFVRVDIEVEGELPVSALGHPAEVVRHPWLVMKLLRLLGA